MNRFAVLMVFGAVFFTFAATGCTEFDKISASEDINMSADLMNSGADRIDKINLEAGTYSADRIGLAASKVDYEEALKILEAANTDYEEEKQIIELNKIICNYSLDGISILEKMIFLLEHEDKANAYLISGDFDAYRSEISQSEDALDTLPSLISRAKAKIASIDMDTVPPEFKGSLLEDKMAIDQLEKMVSELQIFNQAMNPLVDGLEHFSKAGEFIENEEWRQAELELSNSALLLTESKSKFESLKNSEFPEVSVPSIELYGLLTKTLEAASYYESGCRYAESGNYERAYYEFQKGYNALL